MIATRGVVASSLVAAAMGGPSLALAEDTFQAEASLSYSRLRTDFSRSNTATGELTYFFDALPVVKDYPLEQAQFVERIGSLSANYSRTYNNYNDFESLNNGSMYGVTALFARPGTPFFASAGYDSLYSGKLRNGPLESEADAKFYQLAVGAYVDKTTALSLGWSRNTVRNKSTFGGAPFSDSRDTLDSVSISGQHLARLSGGDHLALLAGLSLDAHERQGSASEKNRTVFVQATYYPTKMLGLKLGVLADRGDDRLNEGEFYLAGVQMFVTPTLSLSLDFQKSHAKAPNATDFDFVTLKALARF
ncbi:MAG: putative porin [Betaproteobacteria bacterium]|nr:MAG: putative porin [Betaproteobacteria bacterium]